jgi:hypothetical protein
MSWPPETHETMNPMIKADIALFPPPEVPWPWKISWSHYSIPLTRRDTTQIGESIFCASCGAYGIELGLWKRQDVWAYDLLVHDRQSGGGVPFVDQRFNDPAQALAALDHWLKRVADRCLADGSAIAAITRRDNPADPSRPVCRFTPPSGHGIVNPCPAFVRSLLWWQSGGYWESGSGDAGITFKSPEGHTTSELIFLLREPYGTFLQFQSAGADTRLASRTDGAADGYTEVSVNLCGAPLTLAKRFFLDRNTAADVVTTYIETGTGTLPGYDGWTEV